MVIKGRGGNKREGRGHGTPDLLDFGGFGRAKALRQLVEGEGV